jgi:hypothetical protein
MAMGICADTHPDSLQVLAKAYAAENERYTSA